jgi:hypothetical protein
MPTVEHQPVDDIQLPSHMRSFAGRRRPPAFITLIWTGSLMDDVAEATWKFEEEENVYK